MSLCKFLKGSTTISELENMPNRYIQVLYKEYVNMLKDPKQQESLAAENMTEQLEEAMGLDLGGLPNG